MIKNINETFLKKTGMKKFIVLYLLLVFSKLLIAQSYTIIGRLFNEQNQAIDYANIIIYSLPDTTPVCRSVLKMNVLRSA